MIDKTMVVLDIETTGAIPGLHEIIEIGAIKVKKGLIIDQFHTLVRPTHDIPLFIKNLTGITNETVAEAPRIQEVLPVLKKFVAKHMIVGHNIDFDLSFINYYLKSPLTNNILDTWPLSRIFLPLMKSHSLSKLTNLLNLEHNDRHRALDDAKATAHLLWHIFQRIESLDLTDVSELKKIMGQRPWIYGYLIDILEKKSLKNFTNQKLKEKFNFFDVENNNESLFTKASERVQKDNFPVLLDHKHFKELLKPKGLLAKNFPDFEFRPQQEKILLDICGAFNENKFLLMEAGTGVGKSLSYLIPSIYWSIYNKEKVVIATHTINLQEQLWDKDIPQLREILQLDFKASLIKGRSNYICLRKWENIMLDNSYGYDDMVFYLRLYIWLKTTLSGDKAELNLYQTENELWEKTAADSDSCLGSKCPWFERYCFVMKARRQAELSDILIINHSLLFSDIKTDNRVLPPFNMLIIDEAHHLENGATDQLGNEISSSGLNRFLNTLHKNKSEGNPGLIHQIKNKIKKNVYCFEGSDYHHILEELDLAIQNIYSIRETSEVFFNLFSKLQGRDASDEDNITVTFRLRNDFKEYELWPEIDNQRANLHTRMIYLIENFKKIVNLIDRQGSGEEDILTGEKKDMVSVIGHIKEFLAIVDLIVDQSEKNHVYWLESSSKYCALKVAPINVGEILYGSLMQNKKTIVFTSATLSIDGDFSYFMERTGLNYFEKDKFIFASIDSPFSYEKQALLCAVNDLPDPTTVNENTFTDAIIPFLGDLFRITKGRTMVLFTSHKMLKDVYQRLKPIAEKYNLVLLGHGIDGSRNRIINQFKEQNNSILFGASSFWEGIDLPGDLLKCVVVVKIPFWPPAIPTIEARLEDLESKDIDGFWNYSVPQAVIRLKQGFGRLIRTHKDRGVVVILDKRIISKKYGYKFLRSLPLKQHFKGESDLVLQKTSDWLAGETPDVTLNLYNSKETIKEFLDKFHNKK